MRTIDTPRIYVASLADYNAGRLHGRWIDASQDVDEIREEIRQMLAASCEPVAEEWAIHDYDGGLGGLRLDEFETIEYVHEVARAIEEHGADVVRAFYACFTVPYDAKLERLGDMYRGQWESEKAYAEELICELGWAGVCPVPDELLPYLDMETIASELFQHGTLTSVRAGAPDYGVHVFETEV